MPSKTAPWLAAMVALAAAAPAYSAGKSTIDVNLEALNQRLHGHVVDYTHNHGADRRIWSPALQQPRDLYVYLPPGFDPRQVYPLMLFFHGFKEDEETVLKNEVGLFDQAIACGQLPPLIMAIPDGSIPGYPTLHDSASFFANSNAGCFEDFVVRDVWDFVVTHYPIRPEPEAHILCGASMGGSAAFALGIKHREQFKIALGFFPALNLRWADCHGHYRRPFNPDCWGWRTRVKPHEVIGRFYLVLTIRFKIFIDPLFGRGPDALCRLAQINPIELMDATDLHEGELAMFAAYGGKDQFNMEAQVESFLYRAKQRGITVGVAYDPQGKHDLATGIKLFPDAIRWLAPLVAPYSPALDLPASAK